jgi:hypothetical protein
MGRVTYTPREMLAEQLDHHPDFDILSSGEKRRKYAVKLVLGWLMAN